MGPGWVQPDFKMSNIFKLITTGASHCRLQLVRFIPNTSNHPRFVGGFQAPKGDPPIVDA
jgi:hypothetical protein